MTSLRVRLVARSALVLAVGLIALSIGAERAGAPPPPPPTDIAAGLPGVAVSSAAWGDYDSDGDLDVVIAGDDGTNLIAKIYRNNAGTFADSGATLTGVAVSSVAWGDYDSDGDLDLLLAGNDGTNAITKVYRNDGAGGFTDITAGLTGVFLGSAAWGDYDSDGDLDILITGYDGTNPVSKIYRNDGGTFTDIAAGLTGVYLSSAAWGDLDSDGDLDLALSGLSTGGIVSKIYRNNGGGSFTDIGAPLTNVHYGSIAWGDFNSDGRLDLLITGNDGANPVAKVYRNDGDGAFTAIGAGLTGVYLSMNSAAWGDYDSDGDLDILLAGHDGANPVTKVYSNDGGGAFSDAGAGLLGVYLGAAAWGDYNSDGKLDIVLTGVSTAGLEAKIYRNESTTANTRPEAPTSLLTKRDSAGRVTFSWTASDSVTPAAALSYDFRLSKGSTKIFSPMAATYGVRRVVRMGNIVGRTSIVLSGLANGTYKWSVQAIDTSYAGSAFAGTKTIKLPGAFVSLKLSPAKIRSCRKPSWATYKGSIVPAPSPVVKVTLQKRPGKKGAWKKVKVVKTKAYGTFTFKKVGKGYKKSVWLRVTAKLPGGTKITSGSKRLTVKAC